MALVSVTLNTERYQQTIGQLPECFLKGCVVDVNASDSEITQDMRVKAVEQYWLRAKGTGGYKREEKLNPDLFDINLI